MQSSPNREPIRPQPRHQRNSKRFGNFSPQRVSVEHKSPGLFEGGLGSSRAVADRHGQRVLLRSIAATDLELCRPGPFWNSAAWEKIGRAMSKARKLKLRRLAWAAWDREHKAFGDKSGSLFVSHNDGRDGAVVAKWQGGRPAYVKSW